MDYNYNNIMTIACCDVAIILIEQITSCLNMGNDFVNTLFLSKNILLWQSDNNNLMSQCIDVMSCFVKITLQIYAN